MNRLTLFIILFNISFLSGFVAAPTIGSGEFIFTRHVIASTLISLFVFLILDLIIYMIRSGDPYVIHFIADLMRIFINDACCRIFCRTCGRTCGKGFGDCVGASFKVVGTTFASTVRR